VAVSTAVLATAPLVACTKPRSAAALFQDVPDHPFGLRAQYIKGIRLDLGVRRGLQRQETHLRSIAVRKNQFVLAGDCR
jgi:hypothetical protein